jgi:hypothetical protein
MTATLLVSAIGEALRAPLGGQLSGMAALWHSPRTYDRRLFLQHLQDDAGFMCQHHRGIDECADRNQASHNGTHLQHPNEGYCAYRHYEGA